MEDARKTKKKTNQSRLNLSQRMTSTQKTIQKLETITAKPKPSFGLSDIPEQKLFVHMEAVIVPLEEYKKQSNKDQWAMCTIPTVSVVQNAVETAPKAEKISTEQHSLFAEILGEVLQELVHDEDVLHAFERVQDVPIAQYEYYEDEKLTNLSSSVSIKGELQSTLEWIMEETLFNIVSEAVHGDFTF